MARFVKDWFCIDGAVYVWFNTQADPSIIYNGVELNYYDIIECVTDAETGELDFDSIECALLDCSFAMHEAGAHSWRGSDAWLYVSNGGFVEWGHGMPPKYANGIMVSGC